MFRSFEAAPLDALQLAVPRFPAPSANAVRCLVAYLLTKRRLHLRKLYTDVIIVLLRYFEAKIVFFLGEIGENEEQCRLRGNRRFPALEM